MLLVTGSPPSVQLVVGVAGARPHVAAEAGVGPRLSRRTGDAFGGEVAGDGVWALTHCKLTENALDDEGLHRVNLALAAHQLAFAVKTPDHPVAIADRLRREALLDPPAQATVRLPRKVFEEQRIHCSLEPDMQFRNLAFGERDQRHASELEMFVEGRDIGLIARHPIERFGENDIELASLCIGEPLLDTGPPDHARTRDRRIPIGADDLPFHVCRALADDALLVGDRGSEEHTSEL